MLPELSTEQNELLHSTDSSDVPVETFSPSSKALRVLAYVHLRNIHASTGAGRVARQLTEHLALRGDVALRVLADRTDQSRILPLVGEPWNSYRYHTFRPDTSQQQAKWFALDWPRAESYWPEADIVYCAGESYVPTRKAKLVVTAHDAAFFERDAHQSESAIWRQRLKWKLLFAKLSARADMIHTVSEFSAGRLAHFFPSLAGRIRVVPNAVTAQFFGALHPADLKFIHERGMEGRQFVLIPGGLHFRKNADLILTAMPHLLKKFPDLIFAIAGHCNGTYAATAQAFGSRVRLLGFVEDAVLHALYTSAAVVWFPSHYEGFGMPVLEAMATGSAVIASNSSSIPEIAGGSALLAEAKSPSDHIDKLSLLLEDAALRQYYASLGRARAMEFTWQRSAAQLKRYFDDLL